ncbi:MAG: ABC transporter ATP-binding protein [Bacillota bacterium]
MDPIILCRDLDKNYGAKKVLKGLNLEVPPGTIFALLGTNGSGKTTLIRTLLGLIPKTAGEIRVLEEEPYKFGPHLRQRIGYVSEEQGLYGWMTVQGIIGFCKALYKRWNGELVEKYLDTFHLDKKMKVGNLSHGQAVKLALVLAIGPEPELLILDEPMTGLDPLAQHEFLEVVMKDINREGRTIFFSTHNLADAEMVARHVAILYGGKVQVTGTLDQVREKVAKVKIKGDTPPHMNGVVLSEERDEKTLLVPAEALNEIAAASMEGKIMGQDKANLREAFLFFCSGEGI